MKSDPRVDAYLAAAPAFAQPILRHLRKLIHTASPEIEEAIKWRHPNFSYRGRILCGMAAFQAHATFGFWHQDMKKILSADGHQGDDAMGSFGRIARREDLPSDALILRYLRTALKLYDAGAPARPVAQPKAALPVPADLAAALKKSRPASAAWEKFSPSCRREYIEWITEAKREETRAHRLATTLEWVASGKSRNWKYQNC